MLEVIALGNGALRRGSLLRETSEPLNCNYWLRKPSNDHNSRFGSPPWKVICFPSG